MRVRRPTEAAIAAQALFSLLALLGLAAWVGGVVLFIHRGVTRDGRPAPSRLMRVLPSVLFVAGFLVFMIGLRLA